MLRHATTEAFVGYCHYYTQGFNLVGLKKHHLTELIFRDI